MLGAETIPCFASSPSLTTTWQRPQIPRPPQTESRSTPSDRAASSRFVPCANRPRLPEGVKTTSASAPALTTRAVPPRAAAIGGGLPPALASAATSAAGAGRLLAEPGDPLLAVGVVAHHHVGRHHGGATSIVQRARDRRRHARRDRHRQERGVQRGPVRQAEADVRRAARRVHAELLVQAAHERNTCRPAVPIAPIGITSGSTTMSSFGMP